MHFFLARLDRDRTGMDIAEIAVRDPKSACVKANICHQDSFSSFQNHIDYCCHGPRMSKQAERCTPSSDGGS
jgi:hypothetical protein